MVAGFAALVIHVQAIICKKRRIRIFFRGCYAGLFLGYYGVEFLGVILVRRLARIWGKFDLFLIVNKP
jgi:hypothetical protein